MGFTIEEFLGQLSEIDVKYRLKNTARSVQDFSEIVQICQINEQSRQWKEGGGLRNGIGCSYENGVLVLAGIKMRLGVTSER